jgi:hypothetical protein
MYESCGMMSKFIGEANIIDDITAFTGDTSVSQMFSKYVRGELPSSKDFIIS